MKEDIQIRKARIVLKLSKNRVTELESLVQNSKNPEIIKQAQSLIEFFKMRMSLTEKALINAGVKNQ